MSVVSPVSVQQSALQVSLGQSAVKAQVQAERSLVAVIQQAASGGARGQNLDLVV